MSEEDEERERKLAEERKKKDIDMEDEEYEKFKRDIGLVPSRLLKDPYSENIKWILSKFDREFDADGKIFFKLRVIMKKFGSEHIEDKSFMSTQNSKLDRINRNGEYPGYILSCGWGGEDVDRDRLFYYKRDPIKPLSTMFDEKDDLRRSKRVEKKSEIDGLKFGNTDITSEDLRGANIEK